MLGQPETSGGIHHLPPVTERPPAPVDKKKEKKEEKKDKNKGEHPHPFVRPPTPPSARPGPTPHPMPRPTPHPMPGPTPSPDKKHPLAVKSAAEAVQAVRSQLDTLINFSNNHIKQKELILAEQMRISEVMNALNTTVFANQKRFSDEEKRMHMDSWQKAVDAVHMYVGSMTAQNIESFWEVENKLFRIAVEPNVENHTVRALPVFKKQKKILFSKIHYLLLSSSTGSGKTRCMPFFLSLRAIIERLKYPFIVLTQPGQTLVQDKMKDFADILGDSVTLVDDVNKMLELYKEKTPQKKPVVGIFSPFNVLKLLREGSFEFVKRTRFCVDEVHERHVETDVLLAELAWMTRLRKGESFYIPLHVVMMSATPDSHIVRCFGGERQVKTDSLDDSTLFKIKDKDVTLESEAEIDEAAVSEIFDALKDMANNKMNPGHILVFTSGNRRMQSMKSLLLDRINNFEVKTERKLKTCDVDFSNAKSVNKIRQTQAKSNLLVVPVIYHSQVSPSVKDFARNKCEAGKIKVIFATNVIESSITIDDLAVVVDCGVYNRPSLDEKHWIKRLSEEPVSIQSKMQRRGRVGRVRDGIAVFMKIKGKNNPETQPPEIETADLPSLILRLRSIGIKLEMIRNLPDPVDEKEMTNALEFLKRIGAIEVHNGEITSLGKELVLFGKLPVFIALSILNAAKSTTNMDIYKLFGYAFMDVATSERLVLDPFSPALTRNYCRDSDIATILRTVFEIGQEKTEAWKDLSQGAGLNPGGVQSMLYALINLAEGLKIRTPTIFETLSDEMQKNLSYFNEYFVPVLLDEIAGENREWLQCHRVSFEYLSNTCREPISYYAADASLRFSDGKQALITVAKRPGSQGLYCPRHLFIFGIMHDESTNTNYGSIVHRDFYVNVSPMKTGPRQPEYPHPDDIPAPTFFTNVFAEALISGYINSRPDLSGLFEKMGSYHEPREQFKKTIHLQKTGRSRMISAVPKDPNAMRELSGIADRINCLVPFTATTVITYFGKVNCVLSARNVGHDGVSQSILFLDKTEYKPFALNPKCIDFLCGKMDQMTKPDQPFQIAVTGSCLSYPMDGTQGTPDVYNSFQDQVVTCDENKYVFSQNTREMRVVLLSKMDIPGETPLRWLEKKAEEHFSEDDYYATVVSVSQHFDTRKTGNVAFFFPRNPPTFEVPPPVPPGSDIDLSSPVPNPVYRHMFLYALEYCRPTGVDPRMTGASLRTKEPIPGTSLFYVAMKILTNPKKNAILFHIDRFKSNPSEFELAKVQLDRFEVIEKEMKLISEKWKTATPKDKERFNKLKAEKKEMPFNPLYEIHNLPLLKELPDEQIYQLPTIVREMEGIKGLQQEWFYCDRSNPDGKNKFPVCAVRYDKEEDLEKIVAIVKKYLTPQPLVETLPEYTLTFKHMTCSGLSPEDFEQRIKDLLKPFEPFVFITSAYVPKPWRKDMIAGVIYAKTVSTHFIQSIKFAVSYLFTADNFVRLRIPQGLIDSFLMRHKSFVEIFRGWLKDHSLESISNIGTAWYGKADDVKKAIDLLKSGDLPYRQIRLASDIRLSRLVVQLKKVHHKDSQMWMLNRMNRILSVPMKVDQKEIDAVLDKARAGDTKPVESVDLLGDFISCCSDISLASTFPVDVYTSATSGYSRCYCTDCVQMMVEQYSRDFYNEESESCELQEIFANINPVEPIVLLEEKSSEKEDGGMWPSIPLGQLIWVLVHDNTIAKRVRAWMTAILARSLRVSPDLASCPEHPGLFFKKPQKIDANIPCREPGCHYFLCKECKRWHLSEAECEHIFRVPAGARVCPSCKNVVIKSSGCNHIACTCGKHFCYYCGAGPWDKDSPCYAHMRTDHSGCFGDPPDYRKYVLLEDVLDDEIETFYKRFPSLRPGTYCGSAMQ